MKLPQSLLVCIGAFVLVAACGPTPTEDNNGQDHTGDENGDSETTRESPPESGPATDVSFPAVTQGTTSSGLATNTVQFGELPLVYLRLVIRSGDASDPENLPGAASMVAAMLKEGTRSRTSAELAEAVEFLGADLAVGSDEENVYVLVRALSDHLEEAMEILADVALNPRFDNRELSRLKRRELDRLRLSATQPRYLARRTFYQEIYGEHPYARVDTTPEAVERITARDLRNWHRTHFVPNNAFLVAVGNVSPAAVQAAAESRFARWRRRDLPEVTYPDPPDRTEREVIVVDRPSSVQSVFYVGNLALPRSSPDFVPLSVANQVLGGSAASRLFMDLREERSLTYGAYSTIGETSGIGPFIAYAAVRNEVTADAMQGFMEHLERIVAEAPPSEEIENAERYLSDSFPLQIQTALRVANMIEELRVFGLPDDYWDSYRTNIRNVSAEAAFRAAREYIHPNTALIVAVGRAEAIVEPLRAYGRVRVIDEDGAPIETFEPETSSPSGGDGS